MTNDEDGNMVANLGMKFGKNDYANLANSLSENEINAVTKETRTYVQQERENSKTDDRTYM